MIDENLFKRKRFVKIKIKMTLYPQYSGVCSFIKGGDENSEDTLLSPVDNQQARLIG